MVPVKLPGKNCAGVSDWNINEVESVLICVVVCIIFVRDRKSIVYYSNMYDKCVLDE